MQTSGCLAVMTGRGALIKPWLFEEVRTGRELSPTGRERVEIYRRLVAYMKEHFGDDVKGRKKAWSFLPWHFDFFHRYRQVFPLADLLVQDDPCNARGCMALRLISCCDAGLCQRRSTGNRQ